MYVEADFLTALAKEEDWPRGPALAALDDHEDAVLAAAAFIEEHGLTPFDALHAGVAATADERVLSSETDYDTVGVDRLPLEPDSGT